LKTDLKNLAESFTPYVDYSEEADALNFYFRPAAITQSD